MMSNMAQCCYNYIDQLENSPNLSNYTLYTLCFTCVLLSARVWKSQQLHGQFQRGVTDTLSGSLNKNVHTVNFTQARGNQRVHECR